MTGCDLTSDESSIHIKMSVKSFKITKNVSFEPTLINIDDLGKYANLDGTPCITYLENVNTVENGGNEPSTILKKEQSH